MYDTSVSWPCDMIKYENTNEDNCSKYERLLTSLTTPPLESQSRAVEEVKCLSGDDEKACYVIGVRGIIPSCENMLSFAMAISPWSAEEITVIVLQMEVNMDIDALPRNFFEIIGGNPMAIWIVSKLADLNSHCTL